VVSLSVAALTLVIFGSTIVTHGGDRGQLTQTGLGGRPHEALAFPAASPASVDAESAIGDETNGTVDTDGDSETRSTVARTGSTNTITRDGVTVVTPPLLVPMVNLDESASRRGDQASGKLQSESSTRPNDENSIASGANRQQSSATTTRKQHRHHRIARTHSRRHVHYRIVGLAANRHRVVVER